MSQDYLFGVTSNSLVTFTNMKQIQMNTALFNEWYQNKAPLQQTPFFSLLLFVILSGLL